MVRYLMSNLSIIVKKKSITERQMKVYTNKLMDIHWISKSFLRRQYIETLIAK